MGCNKRVLAYFYISKLKFIINVLVCKTNINIYTPQYIYKIKSLTFLQLFCLRKHMTCKLDYTGLPVSPELLWKHDNV